MPTERGADGAGVDPGPPLTKVDDAYTKLRSRILRGDYPPQMPLRPSNLSEEIGSSLIPIREALRLLERERLVTILPNRGAKVAPLDFEDVVDAYRMRILLELEALRLSFPRITPEDVALAREHSRAMVNLLNQDKLLEALDRDQAMHFELYKYANSRWLSSTIKMLWDHTTRYRVVATPLRRDPREIDHEHEEILDWIEAGDQHGAATSLESHLRHTVRVLERGESILNSSPRRSKAK